MQNSGDWACPKNYKPSKYSQILTLVILCDFKFCSVWWNQTLMVPLKKKLFSRTFGRKLVARAGLLSVFVCAWETSSDSELKVKHYSTIQASKQGGLRECTALHG